MLLLCCWLDSKSTAEGLIIVSKLMTACQRIGVCVLVRACVCEERSNFLYDILQLFVLTVQSSESLFASRRFGNVVCKNSCEVCLLHVDMFVHVFYKSSPSLK